MTKEIRYVSINIYNETMFYMVRTIKIYLEDNKVIFCKNEKELSEEEVEAINKLIQPNTIFLDKNERDSSVFWIKYEKEGK